MLRGSCIDCANYCDEQRPSDFGAVPVGTCRIDSPNVGPQPFPFMPRDGWCRRFEPLPLPPPPATVDDLVRFLCEDTMDAKETAQALLAAFEQMTAAIRENTDSLRKLSERQTHMATKIEDWEKALRDDTDATHAVEAAIAKLTEQVKAGAAQAGLNDPRLDAVLEGIKANSARTAALALSGTPVDTGQPIPDPVPADGTQPTA